MPSAGKWFLLSALIGIVAGVGAITFQFLVQLVQFLCLGHIAGFPAHDAHADYSPFPEVEGIFSPWYLLLVLTVGGLVAGWLAWQFAPEASGHGTDAAIDAFHNKRGEIRFRTPIIKTIASAVTLGTGGSAGREGPIAQIGAGFGSCLATALKLSARDRRILLAAGMGAGVGAIFRAPLAGALFAGEILYSEAELESDVIMPAAVASTVAYSIFCFSLPPEFRFMPLFGQDLHFDFQSPAELLPYTVLAIILSLGGILYIKVFYGIEKLFHKMPGPGYLKACLGGLATGLVGLGLYFAGNRDVALLSALGGGYGMLQTAFSDIGSVTTSALLAVALAKIVTTGLTIGSGGSGGVFGPSMVIGGCLGGAVGKQLHSIWPALIHQPGSFAVVGMAGFFAGCARAPFSTILMVTEMTGSYRLLLPAMWVSTLCFLLMRRWTLYTKQVPTRLESPAHRGDFIVDVLEGMHVDDVYQKNRKLHLVHEGTSLNDIVHLLAETPQRYFPVVDHQEKLLGIFSAEDVRSYLYDDTIWEIANARDVMNTRVITLTPEDDLNAALTRFTALNIDELPVVSPEDSQKILGILRRKETIAAYNRRRLEHMLTE
ncbi:H(+)/Cl(-) exchange transporter ClcA [Aureliella helgolandensis]|uniref:H(+)/Cl(-) exchange transporter ClcA n=2 Tax=Aureliella helgolandensis TaxID=2527968 RepID=A0A518G3Z8_9BACT|nr:H(+)/Cl(-) exchange transporter ClcA [Aureliella helgolandensis]